jgi:hypothetical protein
MLAQNFKTHIELGLSEIEHKSLVKVLGMLERGEIPAEQFHMATTGGDMKGNWWVDPNAECGSPACICGWARHVSGVSPRIFDGSTEKGWGKYQIGLRNLFQMAGDCSDGGPVDMDSTEEAAIALRAYLTTGRPVWGNNQ